MSLQLVFILLAVAGLSGIAIGWVFRWLWILARKGSIELEIKQILLDAREEGKKITARAEEDAKQKVVAVETEFKEKEEKITRAEERVFKREESLDKKQAELEASVEGVKSALMRCGR